MSSLTTAMLLNRSPILSARHGNRRQALDMISVALPALVVSDLFASGMNGLDLMASV